MAIHLRSQGSSTFPCPLAQGRHECSDREYFGLNTDSGLDGRSCAVGANGSFARFENSKHLQSKVSVG